MAQGSYVTEKSVGKVEDVLRSDEEVQFIAKGNKVKVKFQGSTDGINHTRGWPRLVATDRRVFIKVPRFIFTKVESVPYTDLSAANTGSSGLTGTEIKLRTVEGKTLIFRATDPNDSELKQLIDYLHNQITSGQGSEDIETPSTGTTPQQQEDLRQTETCIECNQSVSGGVNRCPNCGFNPAEHKKWMYLHSVLAGVSAMTIIGLIIAPVFLKKARGHGKKYRGGVTG